LTTAPFSNQPANPPEKKGFPAIVIWIAVLLVFAAVFYLVLTHKEVQKVSGRRAGGGGPVTVVPATATKGQIGVYLPAIGTVTPVYTSLITSQVNGVVTAVHYTEGQMVKVGDPLIDIDARPYEATLMQAQGLLQRDQGILAQARMDFERYLTAWSRNAIAKQTLDDQEKVVLQDEGTVKNDEGTVKFDQLQVEYCHITAPISGRVGLRLIDPGNVVQSS
jgi:multidrug efflux system membrane fusion protein